MKKILILLLILVCISFTVNAQWQQSKFLIGVSSIPNLNTNNTVPFTGYFSSKTQLDMCSYNVVLTNGVKQGKWLFDYISNGYADKQLDYTLSLPSTIFNIAINPEKLQIACVDYDGDGYTDLGIKTDNGYWFIDFFANGLGSWDWGGSGFGDNNCVPYPANYYNPLSPSTNSPQKVYLSIKNNSTQDWIIYYSPITPQSNIQSNYGYINLALNNQVNTTHPNTLVLGLYGDATAHPVPFDYNNDNYTDLSVKTDDGRWLIDYADDGYGGWNWMGTGFGGKTSIAAPAKYHYKDNTDNSQKTRLSTKNDNGEWIIYYDALLPSNQTNYGDLSTYSNHPELYLKLTGYGGADAIPIPADYYNEGFAALSVTTGDCRWLVNEWSYTYGGWHYISKQGKIGNNFDINYLNEKDLAQLSLIRDGYFNLLLDPLVGLQNSQKKYFLGLLDKVSKYNASTNPNSLDLKALYSDVDNFWFTAEQAFNPLLQLPRVVGQLNESFKDASKVSAYYTSLNNFYTDLNTNLPSGISNLQNRIYGINLGDEPENNNDYLGTNSIIDFWHKWFRNSSNPLYGKPILVNLLSRYASSAMGISNDADYASYLDKYAQVSTNTPFICFDHYPFRYTGNTQNPSSITFLSSYFYNLNILKVKFPTRNLLAYVHSSTREAGLVDETYQQTQFLAFCPIAYGAKGIFYWPYLNTAVGGIGESSIKYDFIKKINKYLTNLVGPIVMANRNIATLHNNIFTNTSATSNIPVNGFQPDENLQTNQSTILKSVSADDILVGIFSNAPQNNPCFVSSDLSNGAAYYLWVVNKETYADNGVGNPTGTTQTNMKIVLRGRHDGLYGSTRAMIYKGVDDYNNTLVSTPQNTLTPIYNVATNETTITIDVLNPGEGRMIKLFVANDIPIKPQAPTIIPPASGYTYQCTPATSTASVYTYNWYLDNVLTPIHTQTYTYVNDNCPHQLTCTVTYDDCYIESDKSQAELILGKKPLLCSSINPCTSIRRPCLLLAQARYAVAAHPTIANTLTIGIKQYTEDELAKRFFDASALAVEKVQTVSVYNKAGELALEVTDIGTEVANIDLSNLTEGVYTITVNGNNDYKEQQTFEYTVGKTPQQIREELALDNTAIAGSDEEKAIEVLQEELYQKLKENVELLENSEALQVFFLNKEQGNFGIIEKINDALSHYDVPTAQKLINDWLPTTNLELNCLSYYNNFIKYLNGGAFSVNDISELYSLASLCPQKNGEVIYAARSLYNYLASDNDEFADACGNNLARNIVRVKGNNSRVKEAKSSTTIYPNPSKGSFYISFAQNTKGINTINILDIYGRSVLQQKAIGGTRNININQTLAKGIYTVQITNSATGKTETQKLIIQ